MKYQLIVVNFAALFLLSTHPAYASPIISEVHPNPTTGSEWVELLNPDATAVSLSGWKLEDQLSSPSTIFSFTDQILAPLTYQVFELPTSKLNNTADGVTLKNASGDIISSMTYPTTEVGASWSWQTSTTSWSLSSPTPGQSDSTPLPSPTPSPSPSPSPTPSPVPSPTATPIPSPSPTPPPSYVTNLQASEIMACPTSDDSEWLELYNPNQTAITLENWQLQDRSGNTRELETTLAPHSLGVVGWSGSLLNNTGDSLTLLNPLGQAVFSLELPPCTKGQSFIYLENEWQLTTAVTKGSQNTLPHLSSVTREATPANDDEVESDTILFEQTATHSATLSPTSPKKPFNPPDLVWTTKVPLEDAFADQESLTIPGSVATPTQLILVVSAIMGGTLLLVTNVLGFVSVTQSHAQKPASDLTDAHRLHHSSSADHFGESEPKPFVFP